MHPTTTVAIAGTHTTTVAIADLTSGSHMLYTVIVGILVLAALAAGGGYAVVSLAGGKVGRAIVAGIAGAAVATIIGGGYAIHLAMDNSMKKAGFTCSTQYCE
jgi:hypothetical protein